MKRKNIQYGVSSWIVLTGPQSEIKNFGAWYLLSEFKPWREFSNTVFCTVTKHFYREKERLNYMSTTRFQSSLSKASSSVEPLRHGSSPPAAEVIGISISFGNIANHCRRVSQRRSACASLWA